MEPQKPFACLIPECGMAFTNEDHLQMHTKKHDMVLQLGSEQKNFVADQTPTPTRFIRTCEEVGLFQDLQNVNPFDEGFKRAIETKSGLVIVEGESGGIDDALHTPQMVFPANHEHGDTMHYTATNNQRNITVSRSSSDETGAIKEYETTTISKLTNEVTTISRLVGKPDFDKLGGTSDVPVIRHEEIASNKDIINETVSYTNNIIKIQSNIEIRKDSQNSETTKPNVPVSLTSFSDSVIKDTTNANNRDNITAELNKTHHTDRFPPLMSQTSIDLVVDSIHNYRDESIGIDKEASLHRYKRKCVIKESNSTKLKKNITQTNKNDYFPSKLSDADYEVIIKLPNKTCLRMRPVEELMEKPKPENSSIREKLKKALGENINVNAAETLSARTPVIQRTSSADTPPKMEVAAPITTGKLFPVTLVNPAGMPILITNSLKKVGIPIDKTIKNKLPIQRQTPGNKKMVPKLPDRLHNQVSLDSKSTDDAGNHQPIVNKSKIPSDKKIFCNKFHENRNAASKRYRERLKIKMENQKTENDALRIENSKLRSENAALKAFLMRHSKKCKIAADIGSILNI